MATKVTFIITTLWLSIVYCENLGEPLGKYLYNDMKCSPNYDEVNNKLTSYKCDFNTNNGCMFEGKRFSVGQNINDNGTDLYCRSNCVCVEDGLFSCAEDDCPSPAPGCRLRDTLTDCCGVQDCKPPKSKCIYKGKTYLEGTSFYVQDQCMSCVCQEGFKGKLEEPYCIKRRCLEQIFGNDNLQNKCAAVYFKTALCCPATWVCHEKQEIVKISQQTESTSGETCEFGNVKVPYGHGFETSVRPFSKQVKVKCECTLPPLVTCLEV
ncbi:hypothetical protein HHI36_014002 [Cryptolaemus montrouzieri]|uniref:VWFC domain-containing protein n=1 Tax=Cryptolaemus montrouzieri TaxID=559131 RepID=A0ABD2N1G2_9CUCU